MRAVERRRGMNSGGGLPYDAEIEYLRGTGSQWIDTGIFGDIELDFEIKVRIVGSAQFQNILGDRLSSSDRRYSLMYDTQHNLNGGYCNCGNSNQVTFSKSYRTSNYITFKKSGLNFYVNNNLLGAFANQTFTTPNTIALYTCRNNGAVANFLSGDISSCIFIKNGTMIRDYIPVRVGQVGMLYDRVTEELFGNAGTGDFILGNDKH